MKTEGNDSIKILESIKPTNEDLTYQKGGEVSIHQHCSKISDKVIYIRELWNVSKLKASFTSKRDVTSPTSKRMWMKQVHT